MFSHTIVEEPSYTLWNSVLSSSVNGNFEQTFEYGEIMKASNVHSKVFRLLAINDNFPSGILQGISSKIFGFTRVYVGGPHGSGPVIIMKGEEGALIVRALLLALEHFAQRNRIVELKVFWPDSWGMHDIFHDLKYKCTHMFRYTVNLDKSVDALWNSIASNKRKNVRKAKKKGVLVVEGHNHEDLLSFYRMLQESGKRAGFSHEPLSEYEATWKFYKPSKLFLAKWKGKDIAGVFIVIHGNTVFARAAGSAKWAWSARPNDLLHWNIMEWACEQCFSKYHMGLVTKPLPTKGSRNWGLWRWKREWNGNLENIQIFHKAIYLPQVARAIALIIRSYENLTPRQQRIVKSLIARAK